MVNVYNKLATHLDKLPGGYPPTESGVELRILRRLFSEEHAKLAIHLTLIPELAPVVARRAKMKINPCAEMLREMEQKGLVLSLGQGKQTQYMAAQFVLGIWEHSVNNLDDGLIRDMNEYFPALLDESWKKVPQVRTIPILKSLDVHHEALPYEHAEQLVKSARKCLVAPCICRKEHTMVGKGCDNPEESCLLFDFVADYYEKRGIGRVIDEAETMEILRMAEKKGLVLQPANSQEPATICLCCGCCCQVLKMLKRHPRPADYFSSAYIVKADPEECNGCGACVKRCQMEAVELVDEKVVLHEERCIGCGLCVPICAPAALTLERNPERPDVPVNIQDNLINLGKARGKISNASLGVMAIKSKMDRLLAGKE